MLHAAELNAIKAPARHLGHPIAGSHTAEIAAKSLRKAQTATREAGADNVALMLQRRLMLRRRQNDQPQEMIMGWALPTLAHSLCPGGLHAVYAKESTRSPRPRS